MGVAFVNNGKAWVVDKLDESSQTIMQWIGWGTGGTDAAEADTGLQTPAAEARTDGAQSQVTTGGVTGDTYQVVGTIVCAGSGKTITEAGLFDASTAGTMLIRGWHAGVPLLVGDSIEYTFQLLVDQ